MPDIVQIKTFEGGLWTNTDSEDQPENSFSELENLIVRPGKLVKTFAMGSKVSTALDPATYYNICTYFNPNLSAGAGSGSGAGYVYIAVAISASNVVTLYYWTGSAWKSIADGTDYLVQNYATFPTVYHKDATNPIIQKNEILRILPGNEAQADGANESKGLWIGYIDRDFFDQIYVADTDYNSGFYAYDTELDAPDITALGLSSNILAGGDYENGTKRYYKLSYVYDGINESLLSDELRVAFTASTLLKADFSITQASHNKRITAINIYRSDVGENGETAEQSSASFYKIMSIDLTRDSDVFVGRVDRAHMMLFHFYVKDLGTYSSSALTGPYVMRVGGVGWQLKTPSMALASDIAFGFEVDSAAHAGGITNQGTNASWELRKYNPGLTLYDTVASGADGAYWGDNKVLLYTGNSSDPQIFSEIGTDAYIESLLFTNDTEIDVISATAGPVITVSDDYASYFADKSWQILRQSKGLYFFEENGGDVDSHFFDNVIADGAVYPLLNSPSIKINSKFALEHLGRVWKYNVVLDPADEAEVHEDWLAYSELDQYDVCPVSNVQKIASREGGAGTGMALSYGSIVLFKKNAIFKLDINDVTDPNTWTLREAPFKRGNVAPEGVVSVGNTLYFCSWNGIYTLDPNFDAAADASPLLYDRVSEAINDVYIALTDAQKEAIKGIYDPKHTEVIYSLNGTEYGFNIVTKTWRKIDTSVTLSLLATDEDGYVLVYDSTDRKLYGTNANESTGCKLSTKWLRIGSDASKKLVRYVRIRYKSAVALTFNFFVEGNDSDGEEVSTATMAIAADETEKLIAVRYWCSKFKIQIVDSTDNTSATEIYQLRVS